MNPITMRSRVLLLGWWRYRRCWTRRMTACGLTITRSGHTLVPRIRSIGVGEVTAHVRVWMLEGHCPADWENRAEKLAEAFGAQRCHALICGPSTVELFFRYADTAREAVTHGDRL